MNGASTACAGTPSAVDTFDGMTTIAEHAALLAHHLLLLHLCSIPPPHLSLWCCANSDAFVDRLYCPCHITDAARCCKREWSSAPAACKPAVAALLALVQDLRMQPCTGSMQLKGFVIMLVAAARAQPVSVSAHPQLQCTMPRALRPLLSWRAAFSRESRLSDSSVSVQFLVDLIIAPCCAAQRQLFVPVLFV